MPRNIPLKLNIKYRIEMKNRNTCQNREDIFTLQYVYKWAIKNGARFCCHKSFFIRVMICLSDNHILNSPINSSCLKWSPHWVLLKFGSSSSSLPSICMAFLFQSPPPPPSHCKLLSSPTPHVSNTVIQLQSQITGARIFHKTCFSFRISDNN